MGNVKVIILLLFIYLLNQLTLVKLFITWRKYFIVIVFIVSE